MIKGLLRKIVLLVFVMLIATGCYWNDEVPPNEVAVFLNKGTIQNVADKPGGVYTDMDWWADLQTMKIDAVTFSVEDPEVLTKDNQAVGVRITIQAIRKSDRESVENIFTRWSRIRDDQALIDTISATAREGMKVGTRNYTLPELLDNRSGSTNAAGNTVGLAEDIRKALVEDSAKYSVEIINVTVENIAPSAEYMAILSQTANLNAQIDKAKREQELIKQQASNDVLAQQQRIAVAEQKLIAEQAETNVQVEIAQREGEVIAAKNDIYLTNERAFELRRLELLKGVLGDKVMFLPSDAVLHFLQGASGILPMPAIQPDNTTTP